MLKLLYKPVAIVAGIVGGLLSGLIFKGSGRSSAAGCDALDRGGLLSRWPVRSPAGPGSRGRRGG